MTAFGGGFRPAAVSSAAVRATISDLPHDLRASRGATGAMADPTLRDDLQPRRRRCVGHADPCSVAGDRSRPHAAPPRTLAGQVSMGTRIKGRKRFYKEVDIREAPRENVYEPTVRRPCSQRARAVVTPRARRRNTRCCSTGARSSRGRACRSGCAPRRRVHCFRVRHGSPRGAAGPHLRAGGRSRERVGKTGGHARSQHHAAGALRAQPAPTPTLAHTLYRR